MKILTRLLVLISLLGLVAACTPARSGGGGSDDDDAADDDDDATDDDDDATDDDDASSDCDTETEGEDCNGNCFPLTWLGDNDCDEGQWEYPEGTPIVLNCAELNFDDGDCAR
ncbi:MAG: hypothetical protein GY898_30625 [Proteobacteria bacterium]|nr:hypothetical protein [Pseudomonadota bacterium]